jgi:hypothetical protein
VLHAAVDQAPMILPDGSAVDAPEPVSFCFAPSAGIAGNDVERFVKCRLRASRFDFEAREGRRPVQ